MPKHLPVSLLLFSLFSLNGCFVGQRLNTLENQTKKLSAQSERLDSTTTAIEKNRLRIDNIVPADAQWMALEPGGIIRWYLGESLGNIYVQYRGGGENLGEVVLQFSTPLKASEHTMRPGISLAQPWEEDGEEKKWIVLMLHEVRHREGSPAQGLFSVRIEEI